MNQGQQLAAKGAGGKFSGLAEFHGQLCFASADTFAAPGGVATLLLVAPITTTVLDNFTSKLGPIKLTLLDPAEEKPSSGTPIEISGKSYILGQQISSAKRELSPAANLLDVRVNGVATLEAYRADPSVEAVERPVFAQFSLGSSVINQDLLTSVGALGPILVILLGSLVQFSC